MISNFKLNNKIFFYTSLILIAFFGIYLRLYWFSIKPKTLLFDEYYYYLSTAINFINGNGFFPAYNALNIGEFIPPPLYPLFLALLIKISGNSDLLDIFLISQILLSGIMIFISGVISIKLFSSKITAVFSALLIAIHPLFIFWSAYFMTESNYLLLLTLFILSLIFWITSPSYINSTVSGIFLGFLTLQRGLSILLAPFLGTIIFLIYYSGKLKYKEKNHSLPAYLKTVLLFCIVPYCLMMPWMLRNYRYYGDPVWVSSNGGSLLYYANRKDLNAKEKPYWYPLSKNELDSEVEKQSKDEKGNFIITYYRYAKLYSAKTFLYIKKNPLHFLKNYLWKCYNLVFLIQYQSRNAKTPFYYEIWPGLHSVSIYRFIHWFLIVFGFTGFVFVLRKIPQMKIAVFISIFLYIFFLSALFIQSADGRLSIPFRFLLCFFAAHGFHECMKFMTKKLVGLLSDQLINSKKK